MRMFRLFAIAAAALLFAGVAAAQQPIKIGMSMPQTGSLGAGGKAALLALQMWVEDVNAKGGLLGRKVEFIVYDDQTNPALTPAIYTKLLDVDKVDLLIAPYGTVPTAPIMPLVKQRDLLLMGNFSFQVNRTVKHDKWFNNSPWNDAESWSAGFFGHARSSAPSRSRSSPPTRSSRRTSRTAHGSWPRSKGCRSSTARTTRRRRSTSRR